MTIPETPTFENIKPVLETLKVPYRQLIGTGVNKNGRAYTKECLERACAALQPRIDKRTLFVQEPHTRSDSGRVTLDKVVGVVKDAHFDGEHINISVDYINASWKMVAAVVPMSFEVEASCAGSGSEIYEMDIHAVVAIPPQVKHLL